MKTKRPINIIDIIITIALLSIIGATVFAFVSSLGSNNENVSVRYVLQADEISSDLASKVSVGDGV